MVEDYETDVEKNIHNIKIHSDKERITLTWENIEANFQQKSFFVKNNREKIQILNNGKSSY